MQGAGAGDCAPNKKPCGYSRVFYWVIGFNSGLVLTRCLIRQIGMIVYTDNPQKFHRLYTAQFVRRWFWSYSSKRIVSSPLYGSVRQTLVLVLFFQTDRFIASIRLIRLNILLILLCRDIRFHRLYTAHPTKLMKVREFSREHRFIASNTAHPIKC